MSTKTQSYRDLIVCQKSIELAKVVYRLTSLFPSEEKFGLISQMRRAVVSIPSNIAEGQAKNTPGEFVLFLSHAEGSAAELDTQLFLSVELGFLKSSEAAPCFALLDEIRRMLNSLRRSVDPNQRNRTKQVMSCE